MPERPPLAPAPRAIPTSLRYRVLLGGFLPIIAWPMLAIGGFLSTVFTGNSEFATGYRFAGELAEVEGHVTATDETNMRHNNRTVMEVRFDYRVQGKDLASRSFTRERVPEVDSSVVVEYRIDEPQIARIKGMGSAPFPALSSITMLFPTVAIVFLMIAYFRGKKRVQLMREGMSAWGLLTDKEPTNTRINNQRVHKLTFAFVDDNGEQRTATDRTHKSEFYSDQIARHVLWDPHSQESCIVELIPGKPKIHDGLWLPIANVRLLLVFLPAIIAFGMIYAATYIRV